MAALNKKNTFLCLLREYMRLIGQIETGIRARLNLHSIFSLTIFNEQIYYEKYLPFFNAQKINNFVSILLC